MAKDNRLARLGKPDVGLAENTVLSVIMTNALISKQQAYNLAQKSHLAISRRIEPSHTSYDGDISFTISTASVKADPDLLAMLVTGAVEEAVLNGVINADNLFNTQSVKSREENV